MSFTKSKAMMRLLLSSSRNWNRSRRIMTGRSKGLLAKKRMRRLGFKNIFVRIVLLKKRTSSTMWRMMLSLLWTKLL